MFTSGIILLVSDCKRTLGQAPGSAGRRPATWGHRKGSPGMNGGNRTKVLVRSQTGACARTRRAWTLTRTRRGPVFLSSRPVAASGEGCRGRPAGGPRPVQQHGHGGRDQGGADGDQGNLPARHAAGDHAGVAGRRGGGNRSAGPARVGVWIIVVRAEAAGMMSARRRRRRPRSGPPTASRRSLAAACSHYVLRGWVSRRERCAVIDRLLPVRGPAGFPGLCGRFARGGWCRAEAGIPLSGCGRAAG